MRADFDIMSYARVEGLPKAMRFLPMKAFHIKEYSRLCILRDVHVLQRARQSLVKYNFQRHKHGYEGVSGSHINRQETRHQAARVIDSTPM